MKKKVIGVLAVLGLALAVSGFVFAESGIQASAELIFSGATDDRVTLAITNEGRKDFRISKDAYYVDEIGSAGSWDCRALDDVLVEAGETETITFKIEEAVTHGDHSILAFFMLYDGQWYMAKSGKEIGFEYFADHN